MLYRLGLLILCCALFVGCGEGGPRGQSAPAKYAAPDASVTSPAMAAAEPKSAPLMVDALPYEEPPADLSSEAYSHIADNKFVSVAQSPVSTFSIDVDTASYANIRRYLSDGLLPPPAAVRIEEMLNYFTYDYLQPVEGAPFAANVEIAQCPWKPENRLVRIGLKGKEIAADKRPVSNLVFLLDVSGSMQDPKKLPLLKQGMIMLVDHLTENDRVAIVVYAGASGVVLDSTTADHKQVIVSALDNLQAGGSTNGDAGIELAYQIATRNFISKGTNRVILCTDGDFNVGRTSHEQLLQLIQDKAKSGVFLSVLGFGTGNLKDSTMELLADKGNGNYAYIDTLGEARKVLVEQMQGTLITIAKDVKIQIEFNPARASAYRLIGYENRLLAKEDFDDDKKDAGEIGAGHTVTALYEVTPGRVETTSASVEPLRYQPSSSVGESQGDKAKLQNELFTLKLRYKEPDAETSKLTEFPIADQERQFALASPDFAWASAVAAFGMILRDSEFKGSATLPFVLELAESNKGPDHSGYRTEFIRLVKAAISLKPQRPNVANRLPH